MYFCKKLFDSVWQDPKYTSENFPKVTAFLSTSAFHLIRELIWGLHSQIPLRRSSYWGAPSKMFFLKISQVSEKNTSVGVSFEWSCRPDDLQTYLKETPTHVFSCEIRKILKNNYFEEHLQTTASVLDCSHQSMPKIC